MRRSTRDPKKKQHVFVFGAPDPLMHKMTADEDLSDLSEYTPFSDYEDMWDEEPLDPFNEQND